MTTMIRLTELTTTTPLIPNDGDDDDVVADDDDSAEPEDGCEVTVSSVSLDPNAARLEWVFDLDSGDILDEPGGGTTFPVGADSRVGLVSTGAQDGWTSELRIETAGDCGPKPLPVFGVLLRHQSVPIDLDVIVVTQQAWTEGLFEQLACDTSGVCTAGAPSDFNAEVWVLTR